MFDELNPDTRYRRLTLLYILAFSLIWWLLFSYSRHYLDSADMVENFAWGQEWQWGTNKHPPVFGWVTAAWFKIFPIGDNAYYLLNEVNLALAFLFLALAMRRFFGWQEILLAVVLASLVSRFGPDAGYKYNANSGQLPFIAGFLWSFLRALDAKSSRWFVLSGVFAALAILTKYYALVMLAAIWLAILSTTRPPLGFLIKGSMIAGFTALLMAIPHIAWSVQHGWPTLGYMHDAHKLSNAGSNLDYYQKAITSTFLYVCVAVFAWLGCLIRAPRNPAGTIQRPPRLGLAILLYGVSLTFVATLLERIDPVPTWFIPLFLFVGWALVDLTPVSLRTRTLANRSVRVGIAYLVLAVIVVMVLENKYQNYPAKPTYALAGSLAKSVTALYHDSYHQPIGYVGGSFPLPYVLSFYSTDHPHGLYGLDLQGSPWVDPQALAKGNKVAVCGNIISSYPRDDITCPDMAERVFGKPDQTRLLSYQVYNPVTRQLGTQRYTVLMWKPI